jgi:hypothetical protein
VRRTGRTPVRSCARPAALSRLRFGPGYPTLRALARLGAACARCPWPARVRDCVEPPAARPLLQRGIEALLEAVRLGERSQLGLRDLSGAERAQLSGVLAVCRDPCRCPMSGGKVLRRHDLGGTVGAPDRHRRSFPARVARTCLGQRARRAAALHSMHGDAVDGRSLLTLGGLRQCVVRIGAEKMPILADRPDLTRTPPRRLRRIRGAAPRVAARFPAPCCEAADAGASDQRSAPGAAAACGAATGSSEPGEAAFVPLAA